MMSTTPRAAAYYLSSYILLVPYVLLMEQQVASCRGVLGFPPPREGITFGDRQRTAAGLQEKDGPV